MEKSEKLKSLLDNRTISEEDFNIIKDTIIEDYRQSLAKKAINDEFPNGLQYIKPDPNILLNSTGTSWDYQLSDELSSKLQSELMEHYSQYLLGYKDKSTMPTYLFLAGAGTGKSRNAKEFHQTVINCLPTTENELREKLEKAWVFNITFESGTTWADQEGDPYKGIGSRMLFQLLHRNTTWDDTLKYVAPTPENVLELIAKHEVLNSTTKLLTDEDLKSAIKDHLSKVTVILAVDGLQKIMSNQTEGRSTFYQTISLIGSLWSTGAFVLPCCTATTVGPIRSFFRDSHQHRIYLPIASLKAPTKNSMPVFPMEDPVMKILISDCGGHGRAIESLEQIMSGRDIKDCDSNRLMNDLRTSLTKQYTEAIASINPTDALAILRASLTHQLLSADKVVPGTTKFPEDFAQPGLIRYEKIPNTPVGYLVVPYIWFWILRSQYGEAYKRWRNEALRRWSFDDYVEQSSESEGDPMSYWQALEKFNARFRILKSQVLEEGESTSISKVHSGARLNGDITFKNHHLTFDKTSSRTNTFTTPENAKKWDVKCEHVTVNVRECKYCVLNATGAHGDHFTCLDTEPSSNEVSQPNLYEVAKVTQTLYDAERKKAASDNDYFILLTTQICDIKLPNNSGIVDGQNWEAYFGPFADRANIFASEGPLDINTATRTQIELMEGMGPVHTSNVMVERKRKLFQSAEEVHARCEIPLHIAKRFCAKPLKEDADEQKADICCLHGAMESH